MLLVCAYAAAAQTVIESESSVFIRDKTVFVSVVVTSDTDISRVSSSIELLDTAGAVRSRSSPVIPVIRGGKQALAFELPLANALDSPTDDIAWYRLRYKIGDSSGTISMSQLITDLFELRIIATEHLLSGMTYRVRVRAVNPFTEQPAVGVQVESTVELELAGGDNQTLKLNGSGETDAEGFAVVDFTIPTEAKLDGDGKITVSGRKNGIIREAEEDLNALKEDVQFLTMTDKPIYQPDQMLNIRGILLKGGEGKTVLVNSELEFRISDEDGTVLYREKVRSSEFGIAAIGWKIPSNAKLGDYRIEIRDENGEQIGGYSVKVSRYDLPNFVVEAKAGRPYYLPGETDAEVAVRADYLFGKPVLKGKVRVVEETSREWNWKEQKYDVDEGQIREGETDAEGKFTTKFDLKASHEELKDDGWRKYRDHKFAAYFTDLTTNKTEQRRFDIRVTREPIHVYLIGETHSLNPKLPVIAYVSTFYADGSPAECDVEVKASEEDKDKFKTVGRLKTNSYGAGKLLMTRPKIGDVDDDLDFRIIAKDKDGRRGTVNEGVSFDKDDESIQIATDKAIYKPGETMSVAISSTLPSGPVYVDVVNGWSVIDSRFAVLKGGKAEVQIPYSEVFKGELKIAAFIEDDKEKIVRASRGVIFPARQGINVDASFDKAVYKPGEEATVKYGVADAIGQAIQSALGVVVLDKAVEERARTDSDFGGMWRNYSGWLGYGDGFGSVNVKDLNELDLTKPISDEMQVVAEVILHNEYYTPNIFHSGSYFDEAKSVFGESIKTQFEPLGTGLKDSYEKRNFLHPVDDGSLDSILASHKIRFDQLRDPWGIGYKGKFSVEKARDIVTIISAGPDKQFGTKDDFTAFTTAFEYFTPMGKAIDTAVRNYHARTGGFIRDEKTLYAELGVREL
ncbi:MAG: MG2 domain-containing protein, partial [Pyrinomonadaceae bacterium]